MVFSFEFADLALIVCALVTPHDCELLTAARVALNTSTKHLTQGFYHLRRKAQLT